MIRIEFENLKLQLITETDLEQIRLWRNEDHVRNNMDFQQIISSEEQHKWFKDLDKKSNLYFKIIAGDKATGVLNLKDINWDQRSAQAGIFVGEKEHLFTMMPVIAVFVLMKVCFDCLAIEKLSAKIADQNINALNFNTQFGYVHSQNIKQGFDHFICTRDSFYSVNSTIKKLHELFNKNGQIRIFIGEDSKWLKSYISAENKNYIMISS